MNKQILIFGLLSLLLNLPHISFSQDVKERKALSELKKQEEKSQEEVEKELINRHLKIQQKTTRKRIKRSLREAERRKRGKHPQPWWDRWLNSKQQKKRRKRI